MSDDADTALFGVDVETVLGDIEIVPAAWRHGDTDTMSDDQDDETELHVPEDDCVVMTDGGVVTDKDGKPVDDRVAALMDRLENETNANRVLCHFHETGRIGYWSKTRRVCGTVVDIAHEEGYRLDHATTRDGSGYAELVPMDGDRNEDGDGGDPVLVTDGGTHQGRTFEDEVKAQLGDTQTEPMAGGVAVDLVTRQPLFVRRVKYEDLREHYRAEGYNLLTYKTHPYLPVTADDRVFECVYVNGDPERAHKPGETYDFPEGRLMHFPVEQAWDGDGDA